MIDSKYLGVYKIDAADWEVSPSPSKLWETLIFHNNELHLVGQFVGAGFWTHA